MRQLSLCLLVLLATAFAADRALAGKYVGEWKSSSSGNGGALRFSLDSSGDTWTCEASFALDGADVKTVMREVKVQETKVDFSYDFQLQGATLRSHLIGEWNGTTFRGQYETKLAAL
jgi:hypothetical protein